MVYFFVGTILGALLVWVLYLSVKRELVHLDEEKLHLQQEKQIVVEFMHNLVEAIGEGINRQELFQRIVHAAVLSTGSLSSCIFELQDKNILRGVAVEGLFPPQHKIPTQAPDKTITRAQLLEEVLKSETIPLGEGLIGTVAQTGKAVMIEDAQNDPRVIHHEDPSLEVRSIIVAPIYFRHKILGAIAVANPSDGLAFNDTDFSLVQSLAEQAGMAIHNADLMNLQIEKNKLDVDIAVASSIQRLLLPKTVPAKRGFDVDAQYLPAQKVGGDLYDVIKLSENKMGLAIADVTGKGVPASILMAITQTHFRHFAREIESPAKVLKSLNDQLVDELPKDMFITMIYCILDSQKNTLTFARAGHELPLLIRNCCGKQPIDVETLTSEGIALGMVPSELFEEITADVTVPFNSGDMLVLYTDGLTEAINPDGVEYSSHRLVQCIKDSAAETAQTVNLNILKSLKRYCLSQQYQDDITLICAKHL
jgi:sigma-B regulation protein RsbU (phosphoserine phosphatase)